MQDPWNVYGVITKICEKTNKIWILDGRGLLLVRHAKDVRARDSLSLPPDVRKEIAEMVEEQEAQRNHERRVRRRQQDKTRKRERSSTADSGKGQPAQRPRKD